MGGTEAMIATAVLTAAQSAQQISANKQRASSLQAQAAEKARQEQLRQQYAEKQRRDQLKSELATRRARQASSGVGGSGGSSAAVLLGVRQKADEEIAYSNQQYQDRLKSLRDSTQRNLLGLEDRNKAAVASMAGSVANLVAPGSGQFVTAATKLM